MIYLRVSVPKDLMGSSLLKAHQWAKSQLARANPNGGAQDYTIQSVDGTPLTLSDLTNDSYDEVLLIGSVKNNPSKTTNYPAVYPSFNYPSYTRRPSRVGNRVPELLAEDIEPSMVERLVAQRGYFGGLNLIVKLQNTSTRAEQYTSPKFASLLQKAANASRRVKSNPGQVLYTSVNNTNAGILTPGEATRSFFEQHFGITGPNATQKIVDFTKEVRKYGLDDTVAFDNFVNEVLEPFLVVSTANIGLLKALRLPENSSYLLEKINKKSRNKYAVFEDTPIYQKLMTYLPIKSQDFYEGIDYALVAHPYFAYEELATVMVDKKFMDNLLSVLETAPTSFMKEGRSRDNLTSIGAGGLRARLSRLLKIGDQYLYDAIREGQQAVLRESKNKDQDTDIEALRELVMLDIADPDKFIKKLPGMANKVTLVNGLAGFPTTPPPYWPRPIAYSVMDTILENLQKILIDVNDGGMREEISRSLASSLGVHTAPLPENPKEEIKISKGGKEFTTDHLTLYRAYMNMQNEDVQDKLKVILSKGNNGKIEVKNRDGSLRYIEVNDAGGDNTKIILPINRDGSDAKDRRESTSLTDAQIRIYANLIFIIGEERLIEKYNKTFLTDEMLSGGRENLVPIMTLFAAVEEYSTNKYGHNVLEGERVFILELLRKSLESLTKKSGADNTAFVAAGMSESELKKIVKDLCEDTPANENQVITFLTFKKNYDGLKSFVATIQMTDAEFDDLKNRVNAAVASSSLVFKNYILENPLSRRRDANITAASKKKVDEMVGQLSDELLMGDAGLQYISEDVKDKIIEPGVTMSMNKIKVKLQGISGKQFDDLIDILKDVNEITEETLTLLADHKSVPFGQSYPARDFQDKTNKLHREMMANEIDDITEFVRAKNPEFQMLRLKFDNLHGKLDDLSSDIDNLIGLVQAQGQNQFNIKTPEYSNLQAMLRSVRRSRDLMDEVRTVIQAPPRSARTLGKEIPENRFNSMRSTYFEEVENRYYPKAYYKSIDLCLQVLSKLEPVQSDLESIYQQFRIDLPIVTSQDMGEAVVSLAKSIEVRDASRRLRGQLRPGSVSVGETIDSVKDAIEPYFN